MVTKLDQKRNAEESKNSSKVEEKTIQKKAFLLDMDGVIYREDSLLQGAKELIRYFLLEEIPFLFLTNNSAPTPYELTQKLAQMGMGGFSQNHFYTSAMNAADFVLLHGKGKKSCFALGESGLITALSERGLLMDSVNPDYVIVGEGRPSMEKVYQAHKLLENGAVLLGTNPDNWCPISSKETRPGTGSTCSLLENSSGKRTFYLGKPSPFMFSMAVEKLKSLFKKNIAEYRLVMVGDTMETDICGAMQIGLETCLVLSGSCRARDLDHYAYTPTTVKKGVYELLQDLDPLTSYDFKESVEINSESKFSKQKHNEIQFEKSRPRMIT